MGRALVILAFQILDNLTQKCIGISSGLAGSWNCTTNKDQTWHWEQNNSAGFTQLINGNGDCLGVVNGSLSYGTDINALPCNSSPSQYWQPLTSPDSSTGYYYLQNYNSGYVIGVGGGLTTNGASLVQWPKLTHPDQLSHPCSVLESDWERFSGTNTPQRPANAVLDHHRNAY